MSHGDKNKGLIAEEGIPAFFLPAEYLEVIAQGVTAQVCNKIIRLSERIKCVLQAYLVEQMCSLRKKITAVCILSFLREDTMLALSG